jgi:serine/threonine protein kinase/tetratricopeptide (TPR) repeat protein
MNPGQPNEETILEQALTFASVEERHAYLRGACAGNEDLQVRVESLIAAHEAAGGFLSAKSASSKRSGPQSGLEAKPGDHIGRYKLLQRIGEGGCGVVYMAEQEEPVRRRVALKIIKLGMDTKSVVARFEAERQALALMEHPNIAKVHDAGATETGRPYFVMELVRGVKITDYCDEKNLSTQERLDLFMQVCHAVQHAHQKGIIHRDLKPSNILVNIVDGLPVPKVIDFGIAKATNDQRLTDKTVFTAFEQFIGTPAYMSPEQAEISGVDVDTRSDIYSLGVLLYELLTGKTPFDAKELLQAGLDEMRRTIREKEPARPSTKVSTLGGDDLTTTAKRRGLEAPKLINALRGDLDWIVMKCLEKDRARRYETANGLAMDIQRHLGSEPVVACPPSRLYRFQKLVRRNKGLVAATSAVVVTLIIGLSVSTWMFWKEKVARQRAISAEQEQSKLRRKAENKEAKAAQLGLFLKDMLQGAGDEVAEGRDPSMLLEILDKDVTRAEALRNQPWLQKDLYNVIGNVYVELGRYQEAENLLARALTITRQILANGSETEDMRPSEAAALVSLAKIMRQAGKLSEAEVIGREALATARGMAGLNRYEVAQAGNELAVTLSRQFKWAEAEKLYREALELTPVTDAALVAINKRNLAYVIGNQDRHAEGENLLREAVRTQKIRDPKDPELAESVSLLAHALERQGKLNDAEQVYNDFLSPMGAPLANDPYLLMRRSTLLARRGKWAAAASDLNRAIELHPVDSFSWHLRAAVLIAQSQIEEYHKHCREELARFGQATSPLMTETISRDCLILPPSGLDLDLIASLADRAVQVPTNYVWLSSSLAAKALAEYRQGHFVSAGEWAQKVLSRTPSNPGDSERGLQALSLLAMSQYRLDHPQEAKATLVDATSREQQFPSMESGDLGHPWLELVFGRALLNEAKELIREPTPASGETLRSRPNEETQRASSGP